MGPLALGPFGDAQRRGTAVRPGILGRPGPIMCLEAPLESLHITVAKWLFKHAWRLQERKASET